MITDQRHIIRASPPGTPAIKIASGCYKNWKGDTTFIDDLDDHLLNGIVVCRPDLFLMAEVIDIAPLGAAQVEPAWFVRMAVGKLAVLLQELPAYLPKICFCRRGDGRMRVYSLDRFMRLAQQKKEN